MESEILSISPLERRDAILNEIARYRSELQALMQPQDGETAEQANIRQRAAEGKQRKIDKLSAELLKIPVQSY